MNPTENLNVMNRLFLPMRTNTKPNNFAPRCFAVFAVIIALIFVAAISNNANAQSTYFWRTEAPGGNWQDPSNTQWWQAGGGATGFNYGVQWWDNIADPIQTNNTASVATHAFHFASGASSALTFVGSSVRLYDFNSGTNDPYIRNLSGATHVFNFALEGDGDSGDPLRLYLDSTGGLTFNGNITNNGSNINVEGANTSSKIVTFAGVISGTGGMYLNNSGVTNLFDAVHTQSGQLTINAGTARLQGTGDTFGASTQAIRIGTGATLDLNGVNTTVGSVAEEGGSDSGSITLGAGTLTVTANDLNLFQSSISGTGGLTKQGSHTLTLFGTQSYTGTTTVTGGTLSTGVAMSSTAYSLTGGTFRTTIADAILSTAAITLGNGTLSFGAAETFGEAGVTLSSSTTSVVAVDSGINATLSGVVSGSGNLVMSNTGQLNLSGNNSYTGTTTVVQGSLEAQSANALGGTGAGTTVNSGAALRLWNSSGVTYAAEALTLNGFGTNSLGGALRNITNNNTWQGNITYGSGARINSDNGTLAISGTLTGGANNMYFGGVGNITLSNTVSGSATTGDGAIFKDGSGTLSLNANNSSLSGLIRLREGTILITNGNSLGSGSVELGNGANTATLLVNSNATIANRLEVADNSSAGVINVASGQTANVTGILSQTNGTLNTTKFGKDGAGIVVLNNGSGTYNGQLQIGNGSVVIGATGALGTNTSAVARGIDLGLNVGDVSQGNNVSLLASNGVTVAQSIYVSPNTSAALRTIGLAGSGTNTFSNEIYLDGTVTVNAGSSTTDQVNISGAINNTGGLTKTGSGVLLLSGNNGYTGATTISAGTLRIGANDRISSQSAISIASNATLDMNSFSDNLGPISGSGSITLGTTGALSVTVGAGTNSTFSGQITGGGSFTKAGDGQQNLSGSNNFSGVTTVSAGMLELQNADALGNATGNTVVSSGAALKLYSATGVSYTAEALSLSGTGVGGADGALRNVGGTNTWNGAITLSGNSRINADNTSSSPASSLTVAGNITGGANVLFLGANGGNLFISGAISGAGASQASTTTSIYKDGTNNLTLSGNNSYSGDTRLVAGSLTVAAGGTLGNGDSDVFISSGATLNVNTNVTVDSVRETGNTNGGVIAIGSGATLTVNGANKGTFFQNSISGAGGLTMAGSGDTTFGLYGTQSYTGSTTVSGGKLSSGVALATTNVTVTGGEFETTAANILADTASVIVDSGLFTLGGNDTIGALSGNGGAFALGTNALTTSTSANTSFAGALTGSGAVVKQGTGSITLSGANTATGGLFIDNGAVTLGGGSVAFNGIEIGGGINGGAQPGNAAALRVTSGSYSTPITVNGNTNGSGVSGARSIEFANASGSATLSGGIVAEKTFTASVADSAATGVLSGAISGVGGLTKTGNGTLTLSGSGANTFTNLTTVSAGTLNLNKTGGNAIVGDVLVSSGATLLLSASDQVGSSATPIQTVTLSGGTITRASGVSETFGVLSLTAKSFINYSGGVGAAINFRDLNYTPSALLTLELVNFTQGSSLVFQNTGDLSSDVAAGYFATSGLGGIGSYSWDSGSNTFTITAIPEPSTYLAAAGLLAMFLWPARRRLIKDAKSILGLRPNGRDRIESYRNA